MSVFLGLSPPATYLPQGWVQSLLPCGDYGSAHLLVLHNTENTFHVMVRRISTYVKKQDNYYQ